VRLVLGVVDVAYSDAAGGATAGAKTTGDVATILEAKYGIMAAFVDLRYDKIAGYLADSMAASIERLVKSGQRVDETATLTYGGDQKIEREFRAFLSANELAHLVAAAGGGVLSQAAEAGVSHRRKRPYAKRKARPAFVDTGLYMASFRAWTTR
jgi:hypothetical protein